MAHSFVRDLITIKSSGTNSYTSSERWQISEESEIVRKNNVGVLNIPQYKLALDNTTDIRSYIFQDIRSLQMKKKDIISLCEHF